MTKRMLFGVAALALAAAACRPVDTDRGAEVADAPATSQIDRPVDAAPQATAGAEAGAPVVYACDDGKSLTARYRGDRATVDYDGRRIEMRTAISASGARYVGGGLQWWTRGANEGTVAPLPQDEEIASAPGVPCKATPGTAPRTPA